MDTLESVALTSRWIAAARAVESRRADRLFDDPYAEALAGDAGFELLARMSRAGQPKNASAENPYLAIRTRFIDDFVREAVSAPELRQVVLVAAGLDSRAYRLAWPAGCRLFELDRAGVLALKARILAEAGAEPSCERHALPVDLALPFGEALVSSGFDPGRPALWLVEGLLPYLDEPAARGVLTRCAELACAGSALVADLPGQSFLSSPWIQPFLRELGEIGAAWKFGTDQPEAFLRAAGWDATARRPGDDGAGYGRWPHPMAPRGTPGVPQTFLVTASRAPRMSPG